MPATFATTLGPPPAPRPSPPPARREWTRKPAQPRRHAAGPLPSAAWLPGLLLGLLVSGQPATGEVVVLTNHAQSPMVCQVRETARGEPRELTFAPGQIVTLVVGPESQLSYVDRGVRRRFGLSGGQAYFFDPMVGGIELKQVGLVAADPQPNAAQPNAAAAGRTPRRPTKSLTVKLLVDDEQRGAVGYWKPRLERQLKSVSDVLYRTCGLRLQVVATGTWETEDSLRTHGWMFKEFEERTDPAPAQLAIGFSSQLAASERAHGTAPDARPPQPFASHLLFPYYAAPEDAAALQRRMVRDVATVLGAVPSPEPMSIMHADGVSGESAGPDRRPAPLAFDLLNTLALNVVAEELRERGAWGRHQLQPTSRETLAGVHATLQAALAQRQSESKSASPPADGEATAAGEATADGSAEPQFTARTLKGERLAALALKRWFAQQPRGDTDPDSPSSPANLPLRWFRRDAPKTPTAAPDAFVEFFGGDQIPGVVTGAKPTWETTAIQSFPNLLLSLGDRADWSIDHGQSPIELRLAYVRRVVWQATGKWQYLPATVITRGGAEIPFRAVRFEHEALVLLEESGTRRLPIAEVAELHMPQQSGWDVYYRMVSELAPQGISRLFEIDTDAGLRITSSVERSQTIVGRDLAGGWQVLHLAQPAWSPYPLMLSDSEVRTWRFFAPHEVRLSRLRPVEVKREPIFNRSYSWRPELSCVGGPLQSAGQRFGWGLGVHAHEELWFELPSFAQRFQTYAGLDDSVGQRGCARAEVRLVSESDGQQHTRTLFRSDPLIGAERVVESGPLELGASATPRRLVLLADPVLEDRPPQADPFDVLDRLNWLEPHLELEPQALAAALQRAAPRALPAWQGWELQSRPDALEIASQWDATDPARPCCRLMVGSAQPIALRRKIKVDSRNVQLQLGASRFVGAPPSRIEVRVNQRLLTSFEVPEKEAGNLAVTPLALGRYAGQTIALEVRQTPSGPGSLVDWSLLRVADQNAPAATQLAGQAAGDQGVRGQGTRGQGAGMPADGAAGPNADHVCPRCGWQPPRTARAVRVRTVAQLHLAIDRALPDTTIWLDDGVYRLQRMLELRTPGVVLRSSSGDPQRVVIRGDGLTERRVGVAISIGASRVTLADLTVGYVRLHAIQVRGELAASQGTVHNVHVIDSGEQLLKGSTDDSSRRSREMLVACSRFEYSRHAPSNYTNGVDVLGGDAWTVRDCTFRRIRGLPAENYVCGPAILFWRSCRDTVVERNLLVDCYRGIALGLTTDGKARAGEPYYDHGKGVIRNNVVCNLNSWADEAVEANAASDVLIEHNTVLVTGKIPWSIGVRFPQTRAVVRGNLSNHQVLQRDGGKAESSHNVTNAEKSWFVDPSRADLRLKAADSPAIGAGAPEAVGQLDFARRLRQRVPPPDAGAFQFRTAEDDAPSR